MDASAGSDAYQRFEHGFLHPDDEERRDGLPLELLDALTESERADAEHALLAALDADPSWVIPGLGHLRSQRALPRLRAVLESAQGDVRSATRFATTALAIWQIAKDEAMLGKLLASSRQPYTEKYIPGVLMAFDMIHIIHCLAHLPHPEALARLVELEASENYLVAYNARYAIDLRATAYAADATRR